MALEPQRVLVTGGAGFIGSAVVRFLLTETGAEVLNLDALTYAGDLATVEEVTSRPECEARYAFLRTDITDAAALAGALNRFQPHAMIHLAAESHVDRSIDGPAAFVQTNVVGTFTMLEAALHYWRQLAGDRGERFRFVHVSTDEVFGALGAEGHFTEESPYRPNSPYAASKAASDHFARAWYETYGLPVIVTNCSNNYGPYQFPEKLIPLTIRNARMGRPLPIYGDGRQVRDWLYVEDHARALWTALKRGKPGETYAIGGHNERRNLDTVETICTLLDELAPSSPFRPHRQLMTFVTDRPGHDVRYAIDASKIATELSWRPAETFESGLAKTVRWYLDHPGWHVEAETTRVGLGAGRLAGTPA